MAWGDIPGRAAYLWIYDAFVASNPPHAAAVVEVGVALGKSAAYLQRKLLDAERRDVRVYAVDAWAGYARNGEQQAMVEEVLAREANGDWELFQKTMQRFAPEELAHLHVVRAASVVASRRFQDASLDLVVLDAAHDHASVIDDISAWLPKIKPGGAIGGDDYMPEYQGVIDAVQELLAKGHEIETRHDQGWGTWRVQL